jgi:hypothetical protein
MTRRSRQVLVYNRPLHRLFNGLLDGLFQDLIRKHAEFTSPPSL